MSDSALMQINKISKSYGENRVLTDVSMRIGSGEILGLVGENGAGKSTLIKILSGVVKPSSGVFVFDFKTVSGGWSAKDAQSHGIVTIHQELSLVPELSAAENVYLGNWPSKPRGIINKREMLDNVKRIFNEMNVDISPEALVSSLSIASQQMVEIARAWIRDPKLVIFDEPTSSLSNEDADNLHRMILHMKRSGVGIVYVSHRLEDAIDICDRVYVLKDGCLTGELQKDEMTKKTLVRLMIGRDSASLGIGGKALEQQALRIENWSVGMYVHNVEFSLYKGEILGIAGLVGSGRSTLVHSLFGAIKKDAGTLYLNGTAVNVNSPMQAISLGIGLLPEDRRQQALFMEMSNRENISVAALKKISSGGFIRKSERILAERYFKMVQVKAPSINSSVAVLSGGNQQKVVLARWLATDCNVLLFDEPTRGIDVGTKEEIYTLIDRFVASGGAAIIISSELPELIALSDRIVVLSEGRKTGEFVRGEVTENKLMECMTTVNIDSEASHE